MLAFLRSTEYSVLMTVIQSARVPNTPVMIEITEDNGTYAVRTTTPTDGYCGIVRGAMFFDNEEEARDAARAEWRLVITARNATDNTVEITEGFYHIGHRIFRVKMARSGYLYAQELIGTTWTYSPGSMARLKASGEPLDSETAATYGKTFGICALCGRTLTDPVSIERGIGPVCASRAGW